MKIRVGALPRFDRFGRAIAVGLLLLVATFNGTAFAQDGPKAAAAAKPDRKLVILNLAADGLKKAVAAKETAEKMQAYLHELEKTGGQPDYLKPPASEYLKIIFNAEALAALPAPKADDFVWLREWFISAGGSLDAMFEFGFKTENERDQATRRNFAKYEDQLSTAAAFILRLDARMTISGNLLFDDLTDKRPGDVVQTAINSSQIGSTQKKSENARVMAAALRDTVPVWAPLATPQERAIILAQLEKARAAHKDAGIDGDITAVETALKNVRE